MISINKVPEVFVMRSLTYNITCDRKDSRYPLKLKAVVVFENNELKSYRFTNEEKPEMDSTYNTHFPTKEMELEAVAELFKAILEWKAENLNQVNI